MQTRTYVQLITSWNYHTYLTSKNCGGNVVRTYSGWHYKHSRLDEVSTYSDCHLLGVF